MGRSFTRFYKSDDGTRWVRGALPPKPRRPNTQVIINEKLLPLVKGEGAGDIVLAILLAVRNLLRTQGSWCRGHRALGHNGLEAETTSGFAEQWSMFGALDAITTSGLGMYKTEVIARWRAHIPAHEKTSLGKWEADDTRRHADVLRLLNLAIGARKKELKAEK